MEVELRKDRETTKYLCVVLQYIRFYTPTRTLMILKKNKNSPFSACLSQTLRRVSLCSFFHMYLVCLLVPSGCFRLATLNISLSFLDTKEGHFSSYRLWALRDPTEGIMIEVWVCPDHLLTSYGYGTKVGLTVLVMDLRYQSAEVSHVHYMTHSQDHCTRMSHFQDSCIRVCSTLGRASKPLSIV